jgi:hypothetical protein
MGLPDMPVNYLQIHTQIIEMGQGVRQREADLKQKREHAFELIHAYAGHEDLVNQRIQQTLAVNSSLRCALPGEDPLTALFDPSNTAPDHIILAADGSQINPNFHDPVAFGVINVGAFRMSSTLLNETPGEQVDSRLLLDNDSSDTGTMSEEIVALKRDLSERTFLAELSRLEKHPVVALTDGPLELFRDPKERPEFKALFNEYLQALQKLADYKTAAAGYVDRPRSDLLIRTLELMIMAEGDLPQAGKIRPLKGVTDSDLFLDLLQPGQRTTVFGIQSLSAANFTNDLALHFFYLNVGLQGAPAIARVEIPAWVSEDPSLLLLLHACLIDQCRVLGSRPFPYVLHRAHEVAVVHFREKDEISNMIIHELNQQGQWVGGSSNKQAHKDESSIKKRYKR